MRVNVTQIYERTLHRGRGGRVDAPLLFGTGTLPGQEAQGHEPNTEQGLGSEAKVQSSVRAKSMIPTLPLNDLVCPEPNMLTIHARHRSTALVSKVVPQGSNKRMDFYYDKLAHSICLLVTTSNLSPPETSCSFNPRFPPTPTRPHIAACLGLIGGASKPVHADSTAGAHHRTFKTSSAAPSISGICKRREKYLRALPHRRKCIAAAVLLTAFHASATA